MVDTKTSVGQLISIAESQVGYMGKKTNASLDEVKSNPGGKYNKYARDLDKLGSFYNGSKNGYDWCDVFVDWCFVKAFGVETALKLLCQPLRSCGAGTGYSLRYYEAQGRRVSTPLPGDQIFFGDAKSTWHTGIVTKVSDGMVYTVEGNAGTPSAVRACYYKLNTPQIKGYGRPDWSIVNAQNNQTSVTVPKVPAKTGGADTRDRIVYRTLADVPSYYQQTIKLLIQKGGLQGTGNGELNVSEDFCRVMTVLDRLGKLA